MSKTGSPYRTLAEFRAKNAAEGMNFFSRATMKWWKSRIESTLIAGRYFITSEDEFAIDGRQPKRIYSVRYANNDGTVSTLMHHLSRKESAKSLINKYKTGRHMRPCSSGTRCITCGQYADGCTGQMISKEDL